MQIEIKPGRYVVAVSGGVDSMVLLDLLTKLPKLELIVAHFDHGMRPDSAADCQFVAEQAISYGLQFVSGSGSLGPTASEAKARAARYDFLRCVEQSESASAIITAHHQDDVLETAIINLSRGTGRRGLTALSNRPDLVRPLLNIPKTELLDYASEASLIWREDASNANPRYLRNYIRHSLMSNIIGDDRQQFLGYITALRRINEQLDLQLKTALEQLRLNPGLDRSAFSKLPADVMKELLTIWWRQNGFTSYESKTLLRAVNDLQNGQTGAIIPLKNGYYMSVERHILALHSDER